jgi:hypothetical protein
MGQSLDQVQNLVPAKIRQKCNPFNCDIGTQTVGIRVRKPNGNGPGTARSWPLQKHHHPTTAPPPLHISFLPAAVSWLAHPYIPPGHLHGHHADGSHWGTSSLQTFTTVSRLLTEPSSSSRCWFMQFLCTVLKCLVFCCTMSWQQPMWCSLVWASDV